MKSQASMAELTQLLQKVHAGDTEDRKSVV